MDWFRMARLARPDRPDQPQDAARLPDPLAFGAPMTENKTVQRKSPDIVNRALEGPPGLGIAPSPYDSSKPGNHPPKSKKRRRQKRRYPRPDLSEDMKRPTDSGGSFRPDGDLTG